ncbi:hypothetical protein [Nonomuraea indica]|uniref:Uncharacterized protein n=1 Tax=Nonomuraea indica TaxID=1581193 RepID=A0ABW8A896_9ACTN
MTTDQLPPDRDQPVVSPSSKSSPNSVAADALGTSASAPSNVAAMAAANAASSDRVLVAFLSRTGEPPLASRDHGTRS